MSDGIGRQYVGEFDEEGELSSLNPMLERQCSYTIENRLIDKLGLLQDLVQWKVCRFKARAADGGRLWISFLDVVQTLQLDPVAKGKPGHGKWMYNCWPGWSKILRSANSLVQRDSALRRACHSLEGPLQVS